MTSIGAGSSVEAWRAAVLAVAGSDAKAVPHLRASFPCEPELARGHRRVSSELTARDEPSVEQVANTIFPQSLYRDSAADAAVSLFENWEYARRVNARCRGRSTTYFDRLTHYPGGSGDFNQLEHLLRRLRSQLKSQAPFRAIYECGLTGEAELRIMVPGVDKPYRSFPCLSHLSLTVLGGSVHLMAQYRYQYLIRKGLGNYLGLSRLLAFVAREVGLAPGQVTVNAAFARVDADGLGGATRWREIATEVGAPRREVRQ